MYFSVHLDTAGKNKGNTRQRLFRMLFISDYAHTSKDRCYWQQNVYLVHIARESGIA
jgi:hypothetical protein